MPRKTIRKKRGISLLEIMVSIGVLSVGLLGILALMPAASNQAKIGAQQDAAALLARRAFREMNVRWYGQPPTFTSTLAFPRFYCFDPLGVSIRSSSGYNNPNELSRMAGNANIAQGATSAHRVSAAGLPLTSPVYDEIFRSKDELFFGEFASRENPAPNPPQQVAVRNETNTAVKRSTTGNLSWFATIVPRATGFNTVSIAIVDKRTSDEYSGVVDPTNSLIVGGFGEIEIPFSPAFPPAEAWTDIKSGEWLMLASVVTHPSVVDGTGAMDLTLGTAGWYRVQGSGTRDADNDGNDDVLVYSVAGADWTGLHPNPPPPGPPAPGRTVTTHAILIPNVIAVHSRNLPSTQ